MKNIRIRTLGVVVICFLSIFACEEIIKTDDSVDESVEAEGIEVNVDYPDNSYFTQNVEKVESFPLFSQVLLDKGYKVLPRKAAYYKAIDTESGALTRVTMIPCVNIYEEGRLAIIYYFNDGDDILMTAAEYFKEENYDISHPLDQQVVEYAKTHASTDPKVPVLEASAEDAATYWRCVAKRASAGCLGCMLKCYLSGPAWAPCTTSCCAGAVIIGMVSCYFTIAGW